MWTCPKCGARFVNRNQWHSCGRARLDQWLDGLGPHGLALYDRFAALVGACGEFHVAPARTRIAFLGQVRFASITRLRDDEMVCTLALPYTLRSPRFARVEEVVPGWFVHTLVVTTPEQLDDEVQTWIRESYRLMGMRERLAGRQLAQRTTRARG
ncbi:MAG: DUF5655 domain-containing protein [Acidobacteria bacterium]|nr:DUF5655 domain-containing protein [Acidobacteriota bacterium]